MPGGMFFFITLDLRFKKKETRDFADRKVSETLDFSGNVSAFPDFFLLLLVDVYLIIVDFKCERQR